MIPKKIHHIYFNWDGEDLIPNYVNETHDLNRIELYSKCLYKSQTINHDYEHILWDRQMATDLVANKFPHALEFYHNMRYDIQRCDFIRYCILYEHGGIYNDLDILALKKYDSILNRDLLMYNSNDEYVEQDFMASAPRNPLWKLMIDEIMRNYKEKEKIKIYEKWKGRFVLQTTGPRFVGRFFRTHLKDYKPEKNIVWGRHSEAGGQDKSKCIALDYKRGGWLPEVNKIWCADEK